MLQHNECGPTGSSHGQEADSHIQKWYVWAEYAAVLLAMHVHVPTVARKTKDQHVQLKYRTPVAKLNALAKLQNI